VDISHIEFYPEWIKAVQNWTKFGSGPKISHLKAKAMGSYGKNIRRVKIEIEGTIVGQVSNFNLEMRVIKHPDSLFIMSVLCPD
jgi:hypothetical protein